MSGKTDYVERVRQGVTDFASYEEMCEALARMFASREYGTSAANELTQADLDAADIEATVADVQAFVTMFGDLQTWLDSGDRRQMLDRLRRAQSL
jgi:hypothetical protein